MNEPYINEFLTRLCNDIRDREKQVARGIVENLYEHGRQQGVLLGLDMAKELFLAVLNEEDSRDIG